MHHKLLMMNHINELDGTAGTLSRLTQPPLHRFAELMYRKRLVSWDTRLCDRTGVGVRSSKAAGHDYESRPLVSSIHTLPLALSKLEQLLERPSRPNPRAVPAWPARIYKQELFNP